jgi:hypothetical protein
MDGFSKAGQSEPPRITAIQHFPCFPPHLRLLFTRTAAFTSCERGAIVRIDEVVLLRGFVVDATTIRLTCRSCLFWTVAMLHDRGTCSNSDDT